MKKSIVLLLTFGSLVTYAQNVPTSTLRTGNEKDLFTCRHIVITPDNKKILLKENVKIETKNLFLKADSAIFDTENQTLIAYGKKEFIFNGGEAVVDDKGKNTLRYKLKDKTIYLE